MKTKELVTLAILTAMASIIMFIQIPNPIAPFLKLELSNVVVLVAFAIYGFKGALTVGVLKSFINVLIKGPDTYSAIPYLGTMIAIFASITIVVALWLARDKFKLNNLMSSIFVVAAFTIILTAANYFVLTPAYFGWPTVSLAEVKGMFTGFLNWDTGGSFDASNGYFMAVLFAYVPFNVIIGSAVMTVYLVIEKTVGTRLKELS